MLGQDPIAHFRTFGHVVLRDLRDPLDQREAAVPTGEVTAALTAACGVDPADSGGYLPLSPALMADDPRLYQGAAAGWHTRLGPAVRGVVVPVAVVGGAR